MKKIDEFIKKNQDETDRRIKAISNEINALHSQIEKEPNNLELKMREGFCLMTMIFMKMNGLWMYCQEGMTQKQWDEYGDKFINLSHILNHTGNGFKDQSNF